MAVLAALAGAWIGARRGGRTDGATAEAPRNRAVAERVAIADGPPGPDHSPSVNSGVVDPGAVMRVLAARASVACQGLRGEAVFVSPDRVLAAVPCPAPGEAQLHLPDGRELLGRGVAGAPPGTSVIEVPGAASPFAPLGEAALLETGAPLRAGLAGAGRDTLAEAVAGGLAGVDGRPMLRVEGAVGPLAGVVADGAGRIVGLAARPPGGGDAAPGEEDAGLAVPAEAFAAALGREAVSPGWHAAVEAAASAERSASAGLAAALRRTTLLAVAPVDDATVLLVVASRSARPPQAERVLLRAVPDVEPPCRADGVVRTWSAAATASMEGVPADVARRLRRAAAAGLPDLWVGKGEARLDCDAGRVAPDATLRLDGGGPHLAPVPFPHQELAAVRARRQAERAAEQRREAAEAEERAREAADMADLEEGWRAAFRGAQARVDATREERRRLEAERDRARERLRPDLVQSLDAEVESARAAERAARDELDELERRASFGAIPRAWRR